MAGLQYKTRGNSSPQGKPRIYFCCHPKDFATYFNQVSDEILAKQNCAIWYDPSKSSVFDEERQMDLSQMQLFVMSVTTKLLTTSNRALNDEFPFALKHHIPILPLMQEDGLEELFNHLCGGLQFLDKNSQDLTAISYDDKLGSFLSSVLVGDKLAAKVRAAFDAYIFLSYRKKDRKHAQELMCLIHKNDFCRDIAIWYDEFLKPGENFNKAIAEALKKSDLFVLVVTPNLVNETNYVMTTEYPAAKAAGKHILPVEVVSTDRQILQEKYEHIPECVDAHNDAELSDVLLQAVQRMAIQKNDDPQHNFFIGLAYLNGIDLEVDYEKALALIIDAAESGLPDAIKNLVDLYRYGRGVEKNYDAAIAWQIKLVEARKKEASILATNQNYYAWVDAQLGLADIYYEIRRLDEARCAYLETNSLCTSIAPASSTRIKMERFYTLLDLGNLESDEGNLDAAQEYYSQCLELSQALYDEEKSALRVGYVAIAMKKLGDIHADKRQFLLARSNYQSALSLLETLAEEELTTTHLLRTASLYDDIGNIYDSEGETRMAVQFYKKGASILELFVKLGASDTLLNNLAVIYSNLSSVYIDKEDKKQALEYGYRAVGIFEKAVKKSSSYFSLSQLHGGYQTLASAYWYANDEINARLFAQKALEIAEKLIDMADIRSSRRDLVSSLLNSGQYSELPSDKIAYYQKSIEILKALVLESHTPVDEHDLALAYYLLGKAMQGEGVLAYFEQGLSIAEKLANNTTFSDNLLYADLLHEIGEYYYQVEQYQLAQPYYLKELALREQITKQSDAQDPYTDLALLYLSIYNVYDKNGDDIKSLKYAFKALKAIIRKKYRESRVIGLLPTGSEEETPKRVLGLKGIVGLISIALGVIFLVCTPGIVWLAQRRNIVITTLVEVKIIIIIVLSIALIVLGMWCYLPRKK